MDLFKELKSSQTMTSSTMNITNTAAFINSTMETNKVYEELEVVSYFIFIVLSIMGNYLIFNIQKYLSTKAPGAKTLLDEFYIKLLSFWFFECLWFIVSHSLLTRWKFIPWILVVLLVSATNLILIVSRFHLFLCLICNLLMIYKLTIIEDVDDKKVIRLVM